MNEKGNVRRGKPRERDTEYSDRGTHCLFWSNFWKLKKWKMWTGVSASWLLEVILIWISICDVVAGKSITENQSLSDAMNNADNVIKQAEMPQIASDWPRYTKRT